MTAADRKAVMEASANWYRALNAMLAGDPAPLADVYSHEFDVSYMPAQGGLVTGWDAVQANWELQAAKSLGGHVEPIETWVVVGTDIAVTQVTIEAVTVGADGAEKKSHARESSAYRREGDAWKMIAHHADAIPAWEAVMDGA